MFKTLDQIRSQFTVKQHFIIHSTKVTMKRFQRQIQKVTTGYLKDEETVQSVIKSRLIFQETFVLLTERKPVSSFALSYF